MKPLLLQPPVPNQANHVQNAELFVITDKIGIGK